jgi:hypothetical protein
VRHEPPIRRLPRFGSLWLVQVGIRLKPYFHRGGQA